MKRVLSLLMFTPLASGACGEDPALTAAREELARAPAEAPAPGRPEDPPPGKPGEPPPGQPGEPPPGEPGAPGGMALPSGPTVTLRGVVRQDDWAAGPVRIDVFDGDHSALGGPRPGIVTRAEIAAPGPFEIAVPAGSKVWLSAFNDENEDGRPSPVEPYGELATNPVLADADRAGLDITLTRRDPPDQRAR